MKPTTVPVYSNKNVFLHNFAVVAVIKIAYLTANWLNGF